VSRQLLFVLAALPIVVVAGALALSRREPATQSAGSPPAPARGAPPRDGPDVAVAPGRAPPPAAGAEAPEPGNADLARPLEDGPARRGPVTAQEVDRAAGVFAGDWLDYLAGRRGASAVRAAQPKLLLGFAGGEQASIGPGRQGLRGVSCRPASQHRHACVAAIAGSDRLRFVMSTSAPGARVQTVALELD